MAILTTLKEKNGNLSKVKIDEVFCLVRYIAAKIATNNAMPSRIILLVEFLFDVGCNVLLYIEFLNGLSGTVDSILLHFL